MYRESEQWGAVGSSQEQSGAGAGGSSQEQWGSVGSSGEQSEAVRSSQEQWGGAVRTQARVSRAGSIDPARSTRPPSLSSYIGHTKNWWKSQVLGHHFPDPATGATSKHALSGRKRTATRDKSDTMMSFLNLIRGPDEVDRRNKRARAASDEAASVSQIDKKRSEEDAAAHRKTGEDTFVVSTSRNPTVRVSSKNLRLH
jgi:hypothetical protein